MEKTLEVVLGHQTEVVIRPATIARRVVESLGAKVEDMSTEDLELLGTLIRERIRRREPVARTGLELLPLDRSLVELERLDPARSRIAVLHLFIGLSFAEIARRDGRDEASIRRDWCIARAYLAGPI